MGNATIQGQASKVIWKQSDLASLSASDLYALLRARVAVFVVEQDCPYQDLDGLDDRAIHLWAEAPDGAILAYARVLPPGTSFAEASIGRVLTARAGRAKGLGRDLMERALAVCTSRFPDSGIRISAQEYLVRFYLSLGFETVRGPYLEDGIPHLEMLRAAV